jgi:hypothetical protein
MSIQDKINLVNERSRSIEYVLLFSFVTLSLAAGYFTRELPIVITVFVLYILVSFAIQPILKTRRETRILEIYKYQAFPILEIQWDENDDQNFKRAQYHREMLAKSGNEIFKQGIIHVEEIYYNDALFGIAESPEEQATRRADHIKQYLNDWGLRQSKENAKFVKQWVYKQDMSEETPTPVVEATPSVSEAQMGSFWSFPLLTKLMRGNGRKEVEAA